MIPSPTRPLIIEVLSKSTESYDRGKKFQHYRTLETLQEYVLISQDSANIERFTRQPGGDASQRRLRPGRDRHPGISWLHLALADTYEKVDFEEQTET
ncbi:MAG: Uma2 family endonuclease [Chloroflexi bacterium]|nr:Uma2 family endonuclease [Chloroflexota bacterium]